MFCVESDYEKYVQWPNLNSGYDVWNTPYVLADDFVCTNTGPISDIHLWGSWLNDQALTNSITFWLGIYDDVPVGTGNTYSHPGTNLLWQQWFAPGQYAETIWATNAHEYFLDPGPTNVVGPIQWCGIIASIPPTRFNSWERPPIQKPTGWPRMPSWRTEITPMAGKPQRTRRMMSVFMPSGREARPPIIRAGNRPTLANAAGSGVQDDDVWSGHKITWLAPTHVQVTWTGGGYLQSATNVIGPYIDVPGLPISPYTDYCR